MAKKCTSRGKTKRPHRTQHSHRDVSGPSVLEPNLRRAERLVLRMLSVPGPSGQEAQIMDFIAKRLQEAGAPAAAIRRDQAHRRSPLGGQIGNLACKLPGTVRSGRRLLMAHVDTVPLCAGTVPLLRGNHIVSTDKGTALGADDRAGAAVVLATAVEILQRNLPHPPLTFFWTVQEELGLMGTRHARLGMLGKPRLAFNFDGGSPEKLTVGATGAYRLAIRVRGVASHAGCGPEEGVSAVAIASLAIAQLHREGWHGRIEKHDRSGTSNVGVIRGGEATNVVAPLVELRAEARSHDPAFRRRIVAAIERAFRQAARMVHNVEGVCGNVEIDTHPDYEAFKLPDDEPCVLAAEAAIRSTGGRPLRAVCDGGLDANWMTARGVPTVTLGCGQVNPHTTAERLNLPGFRRACRVAWRLAVGTEGS